MELAGQPGPCELGQWSLGKTPRWNAGELLRQETGEGNVNVGQGGKKPKHMEESQGNCCGQKGN